ncbi:hypothetical protein EMIT0347P_40463 [Pseudomonas sp. IT-347P]
MQGLDFLSGRMRISGASKFFWIDGHARHFGATSVAPFFCLGGFWADHVLGVLGVYPLLRVLLIRVPPLRRVTFDKRLKSNQKRLLLRAARSLGLGVPSLRDRSGRSVSGLLRCTSSRCVWLRQTVAALPRPDQSLHSAFRRRPRIKIKSGSRACAHPVEW